MSQLVLVMTESGQGKSTSIKGLDPDTTVLVNVIDKRLPFLGSRKLYSKRISSADMSGNYFVPDTTEAGGTLAAKRIVALMEAVSEQRPDVKNIVVDDYQYLLAIEYMRQANTKGWDKFTQMALHAWEVFESGRNLRDDLNVYILAHPEEVGKGMDKKVEMKTFGKMFREKITPEGYFTIVLVGDPEFDAESNVTDYRFRTQTNGSDPAKSPEGMFPLYIPNDLGLISRRIEEYYDEGLTLEESRVFGQ